MSLLSRVEKGRKMKPLAIMFHAPHGIGKSTFASESPKPIYVGQEENDELDVSRFPRVEKWSDFVSQLEALRDQEHDFKTLVIDTLDGLELTAEAYILSMKGAENKTMATAFGGYGKAYEKLHNLFLGIRDEFLIPLRHKKGMNIVLLVHSKKVKFEDPMLNISYDHYETNLHSKTKSIFEDWVSAIFFSNYYHLRAETNSGKEYAESLDGKRMIFTEERPSHVAKNRFNMPYEIEFKKTGTWLEIKKLVMSYFKNEKKKSEEKNEEFKPEFLELRKEIEELSLKLPEEVKASVEASLKRSGNNEEELNRILNKVKKALI